MLKRYLSMILFQVFWVTWIRYKQSCGLFCLSFMALQCTVITYNHCVGYSLKLFHRCRDFICHLQGEVKPFWTMARLDFSLLFCQILVCMVQDYCLVCNTWKWIWISIHVTLVSWKTYFFWNAYRLADFTEWSFSNFIWKLI